MDKATASDKKKVAISDAGIHKTPLLERYCRLLLLILDKLIAPVLYTVLCVAILLSFIGFNSGWRANWNANQQGVRVSIVDHDGNCQIHTI